MKLVGVGGRKIRTTGTPYTLKTYPRDPNFAPFRSTISLFRDTTCTSSAKIGNAPNDPKLKSKN